MLIAAVFWQRRIARRELEAIRKEGYPVSLQEWDAWYQAVPVAENAALKVIEACSQMVGSAATVSLSGPGPLTPEDRALIRQFLTNNSAMVALAQEAAALKESRYPVNLNQGANTLLPHLAQVKSLVQQLRYISVLHAEEGRPAEALQSYTNALAVCRTLAAEPVLISQLVRIACLALTQPALERLLAARQLTDTQLAEISNQLDAAEVLGQASLSRALAGERCMGMDLFQSSPKTAAAVFGSGTNSVSLTLLYTLRSATGLRQIDFFQYRKLMRAWLDLFKLPFPECLDRAKIASRQFEASLTAVKRCLYPMSAMLLPALEKTLRKEAMSCAQLRAAQSALAIERFRLRSSGRVPEGLGELTPGFLASARLDPFDGKPLRYKKLAAGYLIYSVGDNSKDDGGDPKLDVVFRVPR